MSAPTDALVVLIAEDSAADRLLLSTIVGRQGHRVLTAADGLEAVTLFERQRPDLVLMDALMPVMDGFEAARRIKRMAGESLVPIIFLTSLGEDEALVACLEAGGDDFVSKPYNRTILTAKISAMDRLRRLQQTVLEQRDLIARHHEHLLTEQRVAKAVFDKVAHSGCLGAPNIRYLQSAHALFNGDLLLAAVKPSGGMHVLLGDFTGHGLPAAIGAMPLAEVFYDMTAKGFGLADILREMNAKLKRILPVGVFCCATLLNLSFHRRVVEVWNGGLPDGYLLRGNGERVPLVSRHLPLGILEPGNFDDKYEVYPLALGDRLLLLSDGVVEATGPHGEPFGEARLAGVLDANQQPEVLFDEIQQALNAFRDGTQDDVSLIEVTLVDVASLPRLAPSQFGGEENAPLDWSASFEFRAETLKRFNPLPFLLQWLQQVPGLRPQVGAIYTVMVELYANALEHGVLRLDSSLKRDAQGFAHYYDERRLRLARLAEGHVRLRLELRPEQGGGGRLALEVEDSGGGFDIIGLTERQDDRLSGRGLRLVRSLADRCEWCPEGRSVRVEFAWPAQA